MRFAHQGQFDPLKYLGGLAQAMVGKSGRIYAGTHAVSIRDGRPARVDTSESHVLTVEAVVVATNTPVNDRVTMHTKQSAYRTYAIGGHVPVGSVPMALYWDTADPYHYVRLQTVADRAGGKSELLIVGGEDHKTGQAGHPEKCFERLEAWTRERLPVQNVEYRWSGRDCPCHGSRFAPDGTVVNGPANDNLEQLPVGAR